LSLGHVGTPFLPVFRPFSILLQAPLFFGEVLVVINFDHDDDLALPNSIDLFVPDVLAAAAGSTTASR
jgi:hypothetical protein